MMVEPMNWISEVVRPKIKTLFKRETPENLWVKCPDTGQMVFHKDVEANHLGHPRFRAPYEASSAKDRACLKMTFDNGDVRSSVALRDVRGRSAEVPRRETLCRPAQATPAPRPGWSMR